MKKPIKNIKKILIRKMLKLEKRIEIYWKIKAIIIIVFKFQRKILKLKAELYLIKIQESIHYLMIKYIKEIIKIEKVKLIKA